MHADHQNSDVYRIFKVNENKLEQWLIIDGFHSILLHRTTLGG